MGNAEQGGSTRAALIPVALLTIVALMQIGLVYTIGLTPWKVGGFGMFSSIDDWNTRRFEGVGVTTDGRTARLVIDPPGFRVTATARIRSLPTEGRLVALADELLRRPWTGAPAAGDTLTLTPAEQCPDGCLTLREIQLTPLRLSFNEGTGEVRWVSLRSSVTRRSDR